MQSVDLVQLSRDNTVAWNRMVTKPSLLPAIDAVAARLVAPDAKARYTAVATLTHVPYDIIAVIHEREAAQSWARSIAQGDPWDKVSTHVPKGRGPFKSWEDAAYDALVNCAPHLAKWKDWTIGGSLVACELYNGLGYEQWHHERSPYIWGGTNMEQEGKYTGDGKYNPNVWDTQIGCAPLLSRMYLMDRKIALGVPQDGQDITGS